MVVLQNVPLHSFAVDTIFITNRYYLFTVSKQIQHVRN